MRSSLLKQARHAALLTWLLLAATLAGCGGSDQDQDAAPDSSASADQGAQTAENETPPPTANDTAADPVVVRPPKPMEPVDPATLGPRNDFDLRLLPSNGLFALVVHPRQIFADPLLGDDIELILHSLLIPFDEVGFQPADLSRFTFAMQRAQAGSRSEVPMRGVAVLQFAEEVDAAEIVAAMIQLFTGMPAEEQTFGQTTYFTSMPSPMQAGMPDPAPMAGFTPDDQTVVLFFGPVVEQMLLRQEATGHLATRLAHADMGRDLIAMLSLESNEQLGQELKGLIEANINPQIVEIGRSVLEMLPRWRAIEVSAGLQSGPLATLAVDTLSPPDADRLESTLSQYVTQGQQILPGMIEIMGQDARMAESRQLAELGSQAVSGIAIEKSGRKVRVALEKPALFATVVPPLVSQALVDLKTEIARQKLTGEMTRVLLGILTYQRQHGQLPGQAIRDAAGNPLLSWRVAVLPYIGEAELYEQFKLDEPWDSPHNKTLLEQIPAGFADSSVPPGMTRIQVFSGEGTPMQVGDIPPHVMAMGQKLALLQVGTDRAVPWTAPQDVPFGEAALPELIGAAPDGVWLGMTFGGEAWDMPLDVDPEILRRHVILTSEELNASPQPSAIMPGMGYGAGQGMPAAQGGYPVDVSPADSGGNTVPTREVPVDPPPADPFGVPGVGPGPGGGTPQNGAAPPASDPSAMAPGTNPLRR